VTIKHEQIFYLKVTIKKNGGREYMLKNL